MSFDKEKTVISINTEDKPKHSLCGAVGRFLLFIGATLTFIRNFIANAVMLLLIVFIVIAYNAATSFKEEAQAVFEGGKVQIPNEEVINSKILLLDLKGSISVPPLGTSGFASLQRQIAENLNGTATHELLAIEKALSYAKDDENLECVLVLLDNLAPINAAVAKRIATKLKEVRDSGKKVIASALSYSQGSYIIASAANEIALDPIGEIDLKGLSMQTLYYRDLLDKAMITPYIFRAGHFKSAVEPYLLNGMSQDVKAEYQELANLLWRDYENSISENRKVLSKSPLLPPDAASFTKSLSLYHGDKALMQYESNLVDELLPKSQILSDLKDEYGASAESKIYPKMISYQDYLLVKDLKDPRKAQTKVAVLYGLGTIVDLARDENTFCPDNLTPLLDKIEADGEYQAVVLYLDSPGGFVAPSEMLRRKLIALKEAGIKVYVSVNGTGASGAYMIASAADKIVATSDSIVGSIGVFAVSFGLHELLNHFGVSQDGVVSHDLAQMNVAKPLDHNQLEMWQLSVDNTYQRFISDVCRGRHLDPDDYLNFAEGQVFTAHAALNLGLIDKVGTFDDTLNEVASDLDVTRDELEVSHLTIEDDPNFASFEKIFFTQSAKFLPLEIVDALMKLKAQSELKPHEFNALSTISAPKI